VPVLPSDIDIHTCSRCIRDLLLVAKIRREDDRIGVIANRIRRNTLTYQSLMRFLHTLGIPIVAAIRDSQNYVRAAELGVGVHEMKSYVAQHDVEQWVPLVEWLAGPRGAPQLPPGAASQGAQGSATAGEAAAAAGAPPGAPDPAAHTGSAAPPAPAALAIA
jgi:chromosome partitioning protein